jgi:hypothetical protein
MPHALTLAKDENQLIRAKAGIWSLRDAEVWPFLARGALFSLVVPAAAKMAAPQGIHPCPWWKLSVCVLWCGLPACS